jgi:hypothetical protein
MNLMMRQAGIAPLAGASGDWPAYSAAPINKIRLLDQRQFIESGNGNDVLPGNLGVATALDNGGRHQALMNAQAAHRMAHIH